jgi:hypothetical protein
MKKVTLIWLCTAILLPMAAHTQGNVSGIVTDNSGNPLPYANILLLNQHDSTMQKGAIALDKGDFKFTNVSAGHLLLQVSMVGYKTSYSKSFNLLPDTDLTIDPLALEEISTTLSEVEIVAKKPLFEQQIDKMVVNVESSITAAGGTALEILARSPGITVNNQSSTININGKQGVLIMFNGKQMRLPAAAIVQILSGMSASDIEKIEIITNPSSKYDAQGDAGIINIVTKQSPDLGTNGSATVMTGYGMRAKYSGSLSLNHRTKKFSLYADASHFQNYTRERFDLERTITNTHALTTSRREAEMSVQRSSLQTDYKITNNTTVGASLGGFRDHWYMVASNTSNMETDAVPYSFISLKDDETNDWTHGIGNVNLTHRFSDKASFKVDADYLHYADNNPHYYTNTYYYPQNDSSALNHIDITKKTPIHLVVLKSDFERSFNKVKYEGGIKAVLTKVSNNVSVSSDETGTRIEDPTFSQRYKMKDEVIAAYSTLSFPLSTGTDIQLGARAEHTLMDINDAKGVNVFNLDFWSFFPTAFVSTKLSEHQKLQFSAGRRITRPSYQDIAPFVVFTDPFTYFSGNPRLKPTFTSNFQVSYSVKQFLLALKYSDDKNYIANFQSRVDLETKKTILYSVNIDHQQTYNLNISFPLEIAKWWDTQTNIGGMLQRINTNYQDQNVSLTQYGANVNLSNTLKLPKNFSAEIVGFYSAPSIFGLYSLRALGSLSFGVQKTLPGKSGKLSLNMQDVFFTNYWRIDVKNDALNLDQRNVLKFESRILRLTYTRYFGNNSLKSSQKSTASEDEKYRLKN